MYTQKRVGRPTSKLIKTLPVSTPKPSANIQRPDVKPSATIQKHEPEQAATVDTQERVVVPSAPELEVEKLIKEILGGEIKKENGELFFVRENGIKTHMKNTSSGVKQVAIIQTLLNNNELEPNSFLIMDEPEVNLHPEWQIKFAKILVLLVKELDLSIYIASHSPFFIEAIELYSQYYDLIDDSYFYLTQKAEGYQYDIMPVDSNNLEAIYRNLGQPYDILDKIKMDLMFKKLDGD